MTTYEMVPLTRAEQAAVEELAALRRLFNHSPGCNCKRCRAARAAWDGQLDEAERLLSTYTDEELEQLVTRGEVRGIEPAAKSSNDRWACTTEGCGGTGEKTCDKCGDLVGPIAKKIKNA